MFTQSGSRQSDIVGKKMNQDTLRPMTIRMIRKIKIDGESLTYNGQQVTYAQILCRLDQILQENGNTFFILNDDTGSMKIETRPLSGKDNQTIRSINFEDDIKCQYYRIIVYIKIFKNEIIAVLHSFKIVEDSNQIMAHLLKICLNEAKRERKTKENENTGNFQQNQRGNISMNFETEKSLSEQIFDYIQKTVNRGDIREQNIINEFTKTYRLQQIKDELRDMKTSFIIADGAQAGTVKLF